MSLSIVNNTSALIAQNNLSNTQSMMNKTLQQLSSGYSINSGADNPSGLVISNEQMNQIAGLQTAISNTSQAVSMVQTADGALSTVNDLLTQIRSLAVSAANSGANDPNALAADQAQITNALNTIDSISANTQFESKKILNGNAGISGTTDNSDISFLTAASNSPTVSALAVNITQAASRAEVTAGTDQTGTLAANENLYINGVSIQLSAGESQGDVVNSINSYSSQTGVTAQTVTTGGKTYTDLYTNAYGSAASISVQSDKAASHTSSGFGSAIPVAHGQDIAGTIGTFAATGQGNILTGNAGTGAAGISISAALDPATNSISSVSGNAVGNVTTTNNALVFQIGANAGQTTSVSVANVSSSALGLGVAGNQFAKLRDINVTTQSGAQDAISMIDAATTQVSNIRAQLGATQQDSLTENQNNLQSALQNTQAANSVIRDTNFASATAMYAQQQVQMQVGTTVLQNTSLASQMILSLVKNM